MKTKTYYLTLVVLFRAACAMAQIKGETFKIEGTLTGGKADSVKLSYYSDADKNIVTAVPVLNGHFVLQGKIQGPVNSTLSFTGTHQTGKSRTFFIEPGTIRITGDAGQPESLIMTGSGTQADEEAYQQMLESGRIKRKVLGATLKTEADPQKKKSIQKEIDALGTQEYKDSYGFFIQHPHSYVTEYYMNFYSALYSLDSVKEIYALFTPAQKNDIPGRSIGNVIKGREAGSPGQMAMDFKTKDMNGKTLSLSDFRGKYVILDFWASWCVPCRKSHPHLIQWYNAYKDKGLEIIGIASDDNREAIWKEAIAKDGIGIWHHALAGTDQKKQMRYEEDHNDITANMG